MQRYTLTEYADASRETRAVYDDFMRTTGATEVPIWLKSLGHSAPLARAYWERARGTLFAGNLPLPLKEMIVFVVSARNGARYCSACHAQNVLSLDKTLAFDDLRDRARHVVGLFQLADARRHADERGDGETELLLVDDRSVLLDVARFLHAMHSVGDSGRRKTDPSAEFAERNACVLLQRL